MGERAQSILVMGMHRSGTSCVTSVLESFGVSLGPKDELMPPTTANPRGYFENLAFNRICVNLLRSGGSDWWKVANFRLDQIPKGDLERAKLDLRRLIETLSADGLFALKDPRLCFLLPALKPLFPKPVYVHVVRSPVEVAMSLNERNGFGIAESIALWEAYNRAGMLATLGETRVLVNYGALIADPASESANLLSNLQKAGVAGISSDGHAEVFDIVSGDLHRQRLANDEVEAFLTPAQKRFWSSLEKGQFPKLDEGVGAQEQRERLLSCLEMQSELQSSRSHERQRNADKKEIESLSSELRTERERQQTQKAELTSLARDLATIRAETDRLAEANAEHERRYEQHRIAAERRLERLLDELKFERDDRRAQEARFAAASFDLNSIQADINKLAKSDLETRQELLRQQASDQQKYAELLARLQLETDEREVQMGRIDAIASNLSDALAHFNRLSEAIDAIKRQNQKQDGVLSAFTADIFSLNTKVDKMEVSLKSSFWERLSFGNSGISKSDRRDLEGIRSDFDSAYYLDVYPDIREAGLNPLYHYLAHGWQEGRRPRSDLANLEFLRQYPSICTNELFQWLSPDDEVEDSVKGTSPGKPEQIATGTPTPPSASSEVTPLPVPAPVTASVAPIDNYLAIKQEVLTSGLWDERWYLEHYGKDYADWRRTRCELNAPIDHYLTVGWKAGCRPSHIFKHERANRSADLNPISYFLSRIRPNYHFDENVWIPSDEAIRQYKGQRGQRIAKKVVYCCIIDDYDALVQPYFLDAEWDYVCFTNNSHLVGKGEQGVWEIREAQYPELPADLRNRYHKLHPHELFPEYEESIYVDGNVNIISSFLSEEIQRRRLPLLLPRHFERNCIYEEIEALLSSPRTSESNLEILPEQRQFLRKVGYPEGYGLTENNVIFRRHHNEAVQRIMKRCWDMLGTFSTRDQVSMCYALWKEGVEPAEVCIPNARQIHQDFWVFRHKEKQEVVAHEKIGPAFEGDSVPVFLSCNDSFVGYLGVLLTSIIENSSDERNYDIVVLESDISEDSKNVILSQAKENVSIRFYNMRHVSDQLRDLDVYVEGYVPVETYNKVFLKEITDGYDKILYIDTDIVVRHDIAELYDIELFGKALGASPNIANIHAAYQNTEIRGRAFGDYLKGTLGVQEFENYFQAGIISLDMRSEKVKNLLPLALDKLRKIQKPIFFDQCIFNSVFYGDVFYFSTSWNHVWYLQNYAYLRYTVKDKIFYDYAKGRLDPKIIHYASGDKPTNKFDWRLSSYFWDYASRSPYADQLFAQLTDQKDANGCSVPSKSELCSEPLPRTLVHLHVYYEEQLDYMLEKLQNIEGTDWELVVTANENFEKVEKVITSAYEDSVILRLENKGFDVFPFLKTLQAQDLSRYDYILKLHTKNARPKRKDSLVYGLPVPGHKWRDDLIDAVMGSKDIFRANLERLRDNVDLGCLAAGQYIFSTTENNEQRNYRLRHWMNEFGLESGTHYVGGTMFLARAYPFHRLKKVNPDELDFAAGGQDSGSHKNLAHVFERLFGLIVENEGLTIDGAGKR